MISHQHRCIFVHIPKTAGNSINRVFGVEWQDHKDLARYAAELPPEIFESYFKFAIVRNPWDRLFSDYNYQLKKSRAKNSKLFVFNERGGKRNFAAWVEAALTQPDLYEAERWGGQVSPHIHRWSPQLEWMSLNGEAAVDFVARMENLREGFPAICRRVGLPVQRLPHRNRRLHLHYSHYYDRTTRDLVGSYYARDIAAFGYEFEERMLHLRLFISAAHRLRAAVPVDATNPAALLACLQLPTASAESTRVVSYPSSGRRRPPAQRRFATLLAAIIVSSVCWLGTGFYHPAESEHLRDDASLPGPLTRLVMRRARARPQFPDQPHEVNSLFRLIPAAVPPASTFLWQICPGTLPGDSLAADPDEPNAGPQFSSAPPPPTYSPSSGTSPTRRWRLFNREDTFW